MKGQVTGKDWGQEEKGETEDEIIKWYHQLDIYEFEQTLGDSEGQGVLQFLGLQRVGHNLVTEQQELFFFFRKSCIILY